jgi:hypothetical protein
LGDLFNLNDFNVIATIERPSQSAPLLWITLTTINVNSNSIGYFSNPNNYVIRATVRYTSGGLDSPYSNEYWSYGNTDNILPPTVYSTSVYNPNLFSVYCQFQSSNDNNNWTTIASFTMNQTNSSPVIYGGGPYAYYRARLVKIGSGTSVSEWSTITG